MEDRIVSATVGKYALVEAIRELAEEGLQTDGGHHKQWYLAQILRVIGMTNADLRQVTDDLGIAP